MADYIEDTGGLEKSMNFGPEKSRELITDAIVENSKEGKKLNQSEEAAKTQLQTINISPKSIFFPLFRKLSDNIVNIKD